MSKSGKEGGRGINGTASSRMRSGQQLRGPELSIDGRKEGTASSRNGFILQTGTNTIQDLSREVTSMSMKERYSSFAPQPEVTEARLERQFTFTGYDIMDDAMTPPPQSPYYSLQQQERKRHREAYMAACKHLGIAHVSYIARNLCEPVIRARSHGFGPKEARAIAVALVNNDVVEELDLTDNCIGEEGAKCIATTVQASSSLRKIDLSENKIGADGLCAICRAVAKSDYLKSLHISAIGIKNPDLIHVKNMLDGDMSLRELYLTHNNIADEGCILLGKAIAENDTLEVLDLSWNHIRGKGALAIAAGVKENRGIKTLKLSWNGFAHEGSEAMGAALAKNKTLVELDMSSNRIHAEAMSHIMKGLKKNLNLASLNLSNNPLTPQACLLLLKALLKMESLPLKELDIWDLVVTDEFVEVLDELQIHRGDFRCKYGVVITYSNDGEAVKDDGFSDLDPRELLVKLMEKDGLRIVDLFRRLDEDESWTVTKDEFKTGILKGGLSVTEAQLEQLVDILDKNSDGVVDLREMIGGHREYRRLGILKMQRVKDRDQVSKGKKTTAVGMDADRLLEEMDKLAEQMKRSSSRIERITQLKRQQQMEEEREKEEREKEEEADSTNKKANENLNKDANVSDNKHAVDNNEVIINGSCRG